MRGKGILALVLGVCLVFGITAPLWAAQAFKVGDADVSVYASLRLETDYQFHNRGDVPYGQTDNTTDFNMWMSPISRAGLRINYGKVSGLVEYGLKADSRVSQETYLRHAFGVYNMGGGNSILIGQTWSIAADAAHVPLQRLRKENLLIGVGKLYFHRNQQIRFTHKTERTVLKVAIEDNDNYKTTYKEAGETGLAGEFGLLENGYLVDESTPALDLSFTFKPNSNISLTPTGMIQRYKLKDNSLSVYHDVNVMTWAASLEGTIKTGLVNLDFEGWCGQNVGLSTVLFDQRPGVIKAGIPVANHYKSDIKDVNSYGGWLQFGVPIKPVTMFIGAGYQQSQVRNEDDPSTGTFYRDNVSCWSAFINFKYDVTKQFYIMPEISYFDWGDAATTKKTSDGVPYGNDLGSDLYAGVFFQYNL